MERILRAKIKATTVKATLFIEDQQHLHIGGTKLEQHNASIINLQIPLKIGKATVIETRIVILDNKNTKEYQCLMRSWSSRVQTLVSPFTESYHVLLRTGREELRPPGVGLNEAEMLTRNNQSISINLSIHSHTMLFLSSIAMLVSSNYCLNKPM